MYTHNMVCDHCGCKLKSGKFIGCTPKYNSAKAIGQDGKSKISIMLRVRDLVLFEEGSTKRYEHLCFSCFKSIIASCSELEF